MRFFAFPALALLAACAGTIAAPARPADQPPASTPAPAIVARADTVILTGERAFAAAELVYITAADGVGRLADESVIHGATATQVRGWNAEARVWLVRGHAATDAAEKARAAAALFGLADKLNALRGK